MHTQIISTFWSTLRVLLKSTGHEVSADFANWAPLIHVPGTLQMHGVTSIFGVRWWNQVQNERAQCSHLSTFLKKCSDQNWRYAPRKTCILTVLVHFGILRQALPRPLFGRRMRTPNRYKSVMVALRAALGTRKRGSMIILIFHRV